MTYLNILKVFIIGILNNIAKWDILAIPWYLPHQIKSFKHIRFIDINGTKQLNYNNKLVKTATLLNAIYLSKKKTKITRTLEEGMAHLVTQKYIIPDFSKKDNIIEVNTKILDYSHLTYACLPLLNNNIRTDNIALLEDNIIAIIQEMINTNNYKLKDPLNNADKNKNDLNFNPRKITSEKALSLLAALSFGKKLGCRDWEKNYKTLCNVYLYDKLALLATSDKGHDVFNAAYILYKNTGQKRWKNLMLRNFKHTPSLYPYLVMTKDNIIKEKDLYKEMAEASFFTKKQNTFNQGVINVLN